MTKTILYSPSDLYNKTEYSKGTLDSIVTYSSKSILKEVDFETIVQGFDIYQYPPERMEIRLLKYHSFDSKYLWILGTVWFDSLPVMVFQRGGRYGEGHQARFITDIPRFVEMCKYLNAYLYNLKLEKEVIEIESIDVSQTRADLDEFIGYRLDGYFHHYY